jgi:hypothetical protein
MTLEMAAITVLNLLLAVQTARGKRVLSWWERQREAGRGRGGR